MDVENKVDINTGSEDAVIGTSSSVSPRPILSSPARSELTTTDFKSEPSFTQATDKTRGDAADQCSKANRPSKPHSYRPVKGPRHQPTRGYRRKYISGGKYPCELRVVKDLIYDAVLGRDFLRENGALINPPDRMSDERYPLRIFSLSQSPEKVLSVTDVSTESNGLTCTDSNMQVQPDADSPDEPMHLADTEKWT